MVHSAEEREGMSVNHARAANFSISLQLKFNILNCLTTLYLINYFKFNAYILLNRATNCNKAIIIE